MLRIHFTTADLVRTRVAPTVDPLWEIVLSRRRLVERDTPLVFKPWRERVAASPGAERLRSGLRALSVLSPNGPYFPDFLTPKANADGLSGALRTILGTPRRRLAGEIARLAEHSALPGWARRVGEGDTEVLTRLVKALRDYHDVAIEPILPQIQSRIDADRARRARSLLDDGVEGLLGGLGPLMRWRAPVLEMPYVVDRDLHLDGRGLLLVPSYFCHRAPVTLADPELPPTLVYPIDHASHWQVGGVKSLSNLLGPTRATVLHAVDAGATTTELARRAATSPASVSRHTTVLREAGLIETQRLGPAVLHTLTPLGQSLLTRNI